MQHIHINKHNTYTHTHTLSNLGMQNSNESERKRVELQGHRKPLASKQAKETNNKPTNMQPKGKLKQIPILQTSDPHPSARTKPMWGQLQLKENLLRMPAGLGDTQKSKEGEEEKSDTKLESSLHLQLGFRPKYGKFLGSKLVSVSRKYKSLLHAVSLCL